VLTFAIVICSLLWCTGSCLTRMAGSPESRLESRQDAHPKMLGEDLSAPYEAAQDFTRHQRVYWPAVKRHPCTTTSRRVSSWPGRLPSLVTRSAYYLLILIGAPALYLSAHGVRAAIFEEGRLSLCPDVSILMFPLRGAETCSTNGGTRCAHAVAAARRCCACSTTEQDGGPVAGADDLREADICAFARSSPFQGGWRLAGVYAGVHLLPARPSLFNGSLSIFTDYFRYLPGYVPTCRLGGGYNISLLSTLSCGSLRGSRS